MHYVNLCNLSILWDPGCIDPCGYVVLHCVVQAELRHRREVETERLKSLPEWKQHLLTKRRDNDAA